MNNIGCRSRCRCRWRCCRCLLLPQRLCRLMLTILGTASVSVSVSVSAVNKTWHLIIRVQYKHTQVLSLTKKLFVAALPWLLYLALLYLCFVVIWVSDCVSVPKFIAQVVAEMLNVAAGSIADCSIGRRKAETETNGSPYTFLFAFYHYY